MLKEFMAMTGLSESPLRGSNIESESRTREEPIEIEELEAHAKKIEKLCWGISLSVFTWF